MSSDVEHCLALRWENLELAFVVHKYNIRLPVLYQHCKVANVIEHHILAFVDVGDAIALLLVSRFHKQLVIRYLQQAKDIALSRDMYGMCHARRMALVLTATHCVQLKTLCLRDWRQWW